MIFEGRPRVEQVVTDLSVLKKTGLKGLTGVLIEANRGPFNTGIVLRNWGEYQKYFGDLAENWATPYASISAWMCKIMLDNGCPLVAVRVEHYSDITDLGTGASVKAFKTVAGVLFTNVDAGNFKSKVTVSNAKSGLANAYDITCELVGSVVPPVTYYDFPKVVTSNDAALFLNKVKFMTIGTGTIAISVGTTVTDNLTGGSYAVGSLTETDYIGSAITGTGLHAFDNVKGLVRMAIPHKASGTLDNALVNYVLSRNDFIRAIVRTPVGLNRDGVLDYRNGTGSYSHTAIDTYRASLFTGGLLARNPVTNILTEIPELPSVLAIKAKKDLKGEWFSGAGADYPIKDAEGVVYDFSSPARALDWDDISNAGVNAVINHENYGITVWDNRTLQKADTLLKHENIAEFVCFFMRAIKPIAERRSFKPNDIELWKAIYRDAVKLLSDLVRGRAIYDDFLYQGDQDLNSITELEEGVTINTPDNTDAGGYKFRILVKPIGAVKYFSFELMLAGSGLVLNEVSIV